MVFTFKAIFLHIYMTTDIHLFILSFFVSFIEQVNPLDEFLLLRLLIWFR